METNILLDDIQKILKIMHGNLQIETKKQSIIDLESQLSDSGIWNNPSVASKLAKEKDSYEKTVALYDDLAQKYNDIKELIEISKADSSLETEVMFELVNLHKVAKKQSIICIFSEEADQNNCFIEINAGAGGTEAQDWTEILSNMYIKWAEKNGYSIEIIDRLTGEEAGIKNICIKIKNKTASHAYGWLKFESGVHRLVRISPFDSSARRHTSFASVWVYPEVNDDILIEINEKDLRIDTYRASGAGGQHVNKTDSAIRITHLPTNIVVQCQEDRSQHKNRSTAMKMLQSRLYKHELDKKMQKINEKNASKKDIEWGSQIRSYVLQPYQMVKDVRTGMEKGDAHSVLNGEITEFLEKALEANLDMD